MFIFGGLCGLVFGRALTPTRPTIELETRQEAGSWPLTAPPLHTQEDRGLLCSQGRWQLVLFLPLTYPENPCDFCGAQPLCSSWPDPRVNIHTHSQSPKSTAKPSCNCQGQKEFFTFVHFQFLVFLPLSPTLSTPNPALPYSLLWDIRPRGAAGVSSSPNKQGGKPCKASSSGLPPQGLGPGIGEQTCLLPTHTHTHRAKDQTNRPKSINKHNWTSKEEGGVALSGSLHPRSLPVQLSHQWPG